MRKIWIVVTGMLASYSALSGPSFPPVGERRYIVEGDNRPVRIAPKDTSDMTENEIVLRDPNLGPIDRKSVHKPARVKKSIPPLPKYQAAQLTFPPSRIIGRLTVPRVTFDRETLAVGLSERRWTADFTGATDEAARDF